MSPFARLLIAAVSCRLCLCIQEWSRQTDIHRRSDAARPNIVLILADDLGTNDVGWVNKNNVNDIRTPNLDSLAAQGVKLTSLYVQHVCGPSRAALMTGRYPAHLGLQHANIVAEQENGVPKNESTIASELQALGYTTYGVGKWHLGSWSRELIPTKRGFDNWYGFLLGAEDHFNHEAVCGHGRGLDLWDNERPDTTQRGVYSTHLFTGKAVQFIKRHAEEKRGVPFFMYLAYSAVHTPLQAPDEAVARFSGVQNPKRRKYAAMLSLLDEGVGTVSTALQETRLAENTVLIFFSDNGGQVEEGASNWPLRGWKGSLWEGGVRSQAFIHSPLLPAGMAGQSWGGLVHITDMMPTILGLAQLDSGSSRPAPVTDGVDFWAPLVAGSAASDREEILLNIDPMGPCTPQVVRAGVPCDSKWGVRNAALRWRGWKLIQRYPGDWPSHQDKWPAPHNYAAPADKLRHSSAEGCGPCEFTKEKMDQRVFDDSQVCLFNIEEDPEERCDLAKAMPSVVQQLVERLQAHNRTAVPVRYPEVKPERCNPAKFGNIIQWWAEADGAPAARVVEEPYTL